MAIKYRIQLLRKEFNSIRLIKSIKLNSLTELVKIGGKTISIKISEPSYIHNNTIFYFVDIENNSQMFFNEKQNTLNSNELDLIVSNKMLKDIMSAESANQKDKIFNMILGFIMGALIAGMLALLYITNSQNELIGSFTEGGIVP